MKRCHQYVVLFLKISFQCNLNKRQKYSDALHVNLAKDYMKMKKI